MFKEVFNNLDITHLGTIALLLFFGTFLAVTIYAFSRSKRTVDGWSKLALEEGDVVESQESR